MRSYFEISNFEISKFWDMKKVDILARPDLWIHYRLAIGHISKKLNFEISKSGLFFCCFFIFFQLFWEKINFEAKWCFYLKKMFSGVFQMSKDTFHWFFTLKSLFKIFNFFKFFPCYDEVCKLFDLSCLLDKWIESILSLIPSSGLKNLMR